MEVLAAYTRFYGFTHSISGRVGAWRMGARKAPGEVYTGGGESSTGTGFPPGNSILVPLLIQ